MRCESINTQYPIPNTHRLAVLHHVAHVGPLLDPLKKRPQALLAQILLRLHVLHPRDAIQVAETRRVLARRTKRHARTVHAPGTLHRVRRRRRPNPEQLVVRQQAVKHGPALARLDEQHHLFEPVVRVPVSDGRHQLVSVQIVARRHPEQSGRAVVAVEKEHAVMLGGSQDPPRRMLVLAHRRRVAPQDGEQVRRRHFLVRVVLREARVQVLSERMVDDGSRPWVHRVVRDIVRVHQHDVRTLHAPFREHMVGVSDVRLMAIVTPAARPRDQHGVDLRGGGAGGGRGDGRGRRAGRNDAGGEGGGGVEPR